METEENLTTHPDASIPLAPGSTAIDETEENPTTQPTEIVIGPRQMLALATVVVAAIFVAGFGWWTLSTTRTSPETAINQSPRQGPITNPVADREAARLAAPAFPTGRPSRKMALPPIRKGFEPKPEAFGVKGNPDAPVTIVEFSDYQ